MKKLEIPPVVMEWLWKQKTIIIAVDSGKEGKEMFILRGKLARNVVKSAAEDKELVNTIVRKIIAGKETNEFQGFNKE